MKKICGRRRRHLRVRRKIQGLPERPRLNVFRSLRYMYAQLVDDVEGKTIIAVSTLSREFKERLNGKKKPIEQAFMLGELVAEKAQEKNITNVVFDRAGYKYHGRVKAVADGAKKKGLTL